MQRIESPRTDDSGIEQEILQKGLTAMLEKISQKLIGYRVKAAREAKGWTQDQLTQGMGLNDRQTVSDIENGKRALKPDEMLTLSDLLDRDLEFFIDPFAVAGEAQFSWRATPEVPEDSLDGFRLHEKMLNRKSGL